MLNALFCSGVGVICWAGHASHPLRSRADLISRVRWIETDILQHKSRMRRTSDEEMMEAIQL